VLGVWLAIIAFVAAQAEDLLDTALEGLMMSPGARGSRPSAVLVRLSRDMQLSDERLRRTLRGAQSCSRAGACCSPATRSRRSTRPPAPAGRAAFDHADHEQALASLSQLEDTGATTVLPGHGAPWCGDVAEAVRRARDGGQPGR
jgi:hypothetical protein